MKNGKVDGKTKKKQKTKIEAKIWNSARSRRARRATNERQRERREKRRERREREREEREKELWSSEGVKGACAVRC